MERLRVVLSVAAIAATLTARTAPARGEPSYLAELARAKEKYRGRPVPAATIEYLRKIGNRSPKDVRVDLSIPEGYRPEILVSRWLGEARVPLEPGDGRPLLLLFPAFPHMPSTKLGFQVAERLVREHGTRHLRVLALDVWNAYPEKASTRKAFEDLPEEIPHAFGVGNPYTMNASARAFGIANTPAVAVVDAQGRLRLRRTATEEAHYREVAELLDRLLDEAAEGEEAPED